MASTVTFRVDDTLVVEVRALASKLGLGLDESVSLLIGMGIAVAVDVGLIESRATVPVDRDAAVAYAEELLMRIRRN